MRTICRYGWLLIFGLITLPAAAQRPNVPGAASNGATTYSIRGTIRDAATNHEMENIRVDLRSAGGGLVGSSISDFGGDFEFDGLGSSDYFLEIRAPGYQPLRQEVTVNGFSVIGLQVMLRSSQPVHPESTDATVSKRELLIPRKAKDAMMKGERLLFEKSDAKGSLKEFERAEQAYPGYYEAYAQMGLAYIKLGQKDKAEDSLRKSMSLSEQHYAEAYWLLAMLYTNGKQYADAEPLARKAVALDENAWQGHFELSRALLGLNEDSEAETNANAAVTLEPDNASIRLLLANVHLHMRNYPALVDDLNAYLKIDPKGPTADKARALRDKVQQALADAAARSTGAKEPAAKP